MGLGDEDSPMEKKSTAGVLDIDSLARGIDSSTEMFAFPRDTEVGDRKSVV